jgi:hypothetical protein
MWQVLGVTDARSVRLAAGAQLHLGDVVQLVVVGAATAHRGALIMSAVNSATPSHPCARHARHGTAPVPTEADCGRGVRGQREEAGIITLGQPVLAHCIPHDEIGRSILGGRADKPPLCPVGCGLPCRRWIVRDTLVDDRVVVRLHPLA